MVVENQKCRCEKPEPTGAYICGAFQLCAKCKKVANWREFEPDPEVT
jgi:hypothetical protein